MTTTTCTACSDPHLAFAHGGRADFKGKHKTWYSMLSARNVTFNALFMHDDFKNMFKVVHGSAMKAATWVLRTNATGRIVTIEYNATTTSGMRALVRVDGSAAATWVHHKAPAFQLENVRVEMRAKRLSGAGKKPWHGTALLVNTGLWSIGVWSKPYPNAAANPGKALLNIQIDPLYDADHDPVAPHGLIGQSWDGDGMATNGLLDDYSAQEVTTQAMAEGAIEGAAEDYAMNHKFGTDFKYTRFDAKSAKHRDTSKLSAPKRVAGASTSAGAAEDVATELEQEPAADSSLVKRVTHSIKELFGLSA